MIRKKPTDLKINAGLKKLRKPICHENIEACQKLTKAKMKNISQDESTLSWAQASHQSSTISNVTSTRKIVGKTFTKKFRRI